MKNLYYTLRDITAILILTIFSMMLGGIWLDSWEINKLLLPLHYFIGPFIYLIVFLLGLKFLNKKVYHSSYLKLSPKFKPIYFYYGLGLLLLCLIGTIIVDGKIVFPKMDNYLFAQNISGFIGTFLIAPLIEEIVFRGVILSQIAKRYGIYVGIIVSSLIFGAVHLMNGSLDSISMIQLIFSGTLMAILLSIIYVSEKSLWASFTVHALYNGISSLIPVQISLTNDWPIIFLLNSKNRIITGGQYGFDCSLVTNTAIILIIIIILFILYRKGLSLKKSWENIEPSNNIKEKYSNYNLSVDSSLSSGIDDV